MSFPYDLDLMFGSEKSTADSKGRTSFGSSGGGGGDDPSGGRKSISFPIATPFYNYDDDTEGNLEYNDFYDNTYVSSPFMVNIGVNIEANFLVSEWGPSKIKDFEIVSNDALERFDIIFNFKDGTSSEPIEFSDNNPSFYLDDEEYGLCLYMIIQDQVPEKDTHISIDYNSLLKKYTLTKRGNIKRLSTAHLEDVKLVDGVSQEIQDWWDTNPELEYKPYPLTSRGTGTRLWYGDYFAHFMSSEGMYVTFLDSSTYLPVITGKVVLEHPNEIILPVSMPSYWSK